MMKYFHSWSGGKDSTAAIILDHIHGLPPSRIVFCEVMYDRKNGISGELPEHIDFVKNVAIPKFAEWGFTVDLITAETDYLENFFHVISKSRNGNNGKMRGFPLSGRCTIQRDCKLKPIADYYKRLGLKPADFTQYVGVAIDEPERLERLRGTNKVSLLERYGYTEKMAHLKENRPDLWAELQRLDNVQGRVTKGFKYGETFAQVARRVEQWIRNRDLTEQQLSLFDQF